MNGGKNSIGDNDRTDGMSDEGVQIGDIIESIGEPKNPNQERTNIDYPSSNNQTFDSEQVQKPNSDLTNNANNANNVNSEGSNGNGEIQNKQLNLDDTIELNIVASSIDFGLGHKNGDKPSSIDEEPPSLDNGNNADPHSSKNMIPIYAEEARQFLYCKRIPYWRRIGSFSGYETKLMKRGREYHNKRSKYQHKRKDDIDAMRDRFYYDPIRKIGGKIDLLRIQDDQIIPVEIKRFSYKRNRPSKGHITQAIMGGMAAEYEMKKPMHEIEIQYRNGIRSKISVSEENKTQVIDVVNDLRTMINTQKLPEPTPHKKKCNTCEYWKICHRI